jgi:catechol 2,3-dioxygenase-like lactoylglutathione lyase family enzyme
MPIAPRSLDHVALWVADRDPLSTFLCSHLGMHEIDKTEKFTLVGADARRGKLTLFAAEGPREQGLLSRVVLRVADLDAALAKLPEEVVVARDNGVATFDGPQGLRLGLVEADGSVDYDIDHVVLQVPHPERTAAGLETLGFERDGERLVVADKHLRLENGGSGAAADGGDRAGGPLLNHIALLVESAAELQSEAERRGLEIADVVDAANTLAVFVWGPDRIKLEYVEHKATFALV